MNYSFILDTIYVSFNSRYLLSNCLPGTTNFKVVFEYLSRLRFNAANNAR